MNCPLDTSSMTCLHFERRQNEKKKFENSAKRVGYYAKRKLFSIFANRFETPQKYRDAQVIQDCYRAPYVCQPGIENFQVLLNSADASVLLRVYETILEAVSPLIALNRAGCTVSERSTQVEVAIRFLTFFCNRNRRELSIDQLTVRLCNK